MMSIHRCSSCKHDYNWHAGRDCSYGFCRCAKPTGGETPETIPTFLTAGRGRSDEFLEPGQQKVGPWKMKTCGCEHCWSAYRKVVSA